LLDPLTQQLMKDPVKLPCSGSLYVQFVGVSSAHSLEIQVEPAQRATGNAPLVVLRAAALELKPLRLPRAPTAQISAEL